MPTATRCCWSTTTSRAWRPSWTACSRCTSASSWPRARPSEVMANETVRRVYLGGAIETSARKPRPRPPVASRCSRSRMSACSTARRRRSSGSRSSVGEGEFVSVVGLNGAGKTTLFNAISGLVPCSGRVRWQGEALAGRTPGAIARGGIVQCPESRELFGDMSRAREPRPRRRTASACGSRLRPNWPGCSSLFPILEARADTAGRPHPFGGGAADAGDRAGR